MKYFFSGWEHFLRAIKNKNVLLLFDFDGTLTPIVSTPARARLSKSIRKYLKKLSRKRNIDIGIVSGRGLDDIMRRVGVKGIYYAGNHGLEVRGPKKIFIHPLYKIYSPYIKKIAGALAHSACRIRGAILEYKGLSLSLHYRLVRPKDVFRMKFLFKKVCKPYVISGKIKLTAGKKVLEVRPPVSWDKGKAVKKVGEMAGKRNSVKVFVGDDFTDEDAFNALGKKDFPIRVSRKKSSKARYFLKDPNEVKRLIVKIYKVMALVCIVLSPFVIMLTGVNAKEPVNGETVKVLTKAYIAATEDHWEISINRYLAIGKDAAKPRAAVVLCHGFNINNTFWDLDKRVSLARFLARVGYDVWAPSLRGSGLSSKPLLSSFRSIAKFDLVRLPRMFMRAPFDITKFTWTIDDHIHKDIPAIINLVKKESGFDKLYWIGHSMGGIIMYGYLETESQEDIAGFIPIGSMMVIRRPLTPPLERIANQKQLLTASLLVNTTVASQLRNLTLGTVKSPMEGLLFEEGNMDDDILFRFFRTSIDDTSSGVVSQFSDSIRAGSMLSSKKDYNYTENMNRVRVPILLMSGASDAFVDEGAMKGAFKMVSSKDKSMVIFSKASGYSADYGHCDLILGKNSEMEVYPVIANWLNKQTAR